MTDDPARTRRKQWIRDLDNPDPTTRADAAQALGQWVETGEWPNTGGDNE
jgi:hypothetical protein